VQLGRRIALEDAEIEGVTVTRGQLFFLLVGAANRDPAEFAEPDRLNVARPGVRALSFGGGIHHCLGAQLSRIEVEIALATLFRRLPGLVLDGIDDPDWMPTWAIRGLRALPAHW
jgi:cytochrome P450